MFIKEEEYFVEFVYDWRGVKGNTTFKFSHGF